ncbi:GNAT family N-acetyltransferase [Candidatus Kaiserbacteria bacterium]|nr:GNAT family N-acetyltransferase [Candidatus Kaiserbacteria bacterium]
MEPLRIYTERDDVLLREVTPDEKPLLGELAERNRAYLERAKEYGWSALRGARMAKKVAFTVRSSRFRHEMGVWVCGQLSGVVEFRGLPEDGYAQIGYFLDEKMNGKGYMTCALRATASHTFTECGCVCITANVRAENTKSRKVLERVGFSATSEYYSFVNYALPVEDWRP